MNESSSSLPEPLPLRWLPGRFAIARLRPRDALPDWACDTNCEFLSITRTADELSIIAPQEFVPSNVIAERNFAALRIVGTLDFSAVGILARLTTALAEAGISAVAVSTYDTDYFLVRITDQARAESTLRESTTFV